MYAVTKSIFSLSLFHIQNDKKTEEIFSLSLFNIQNDKKTEEILLYHLSLEKMIILSILFLRLNNQKEIIWT